MEGRMGDTDPASPLGEECQGHSGEEFYEVRKKPHIYQLQFTVWFNLLFTFFFFFALYPISSSNNCGMVCNTFLFVCNRTVIQKIK